jgi:hypothetical protein
VEAKKGQLRAAGYPLKRMTRQSTKGSVNMTIVKALASARNVEESVIMAEMEALKASKK